MTPEPHMLYGYDNENSQAESLNTATGKLSWNRDFSSCCCFLRRVLTNNKHAKPSATESQK
jgi:hypothetical protein